ncbi:hypothetical protein G6F43_014294 [Rhizopus delemar]|nr:hypothetical protein G6F43_014294 [Rhizopus delemar]
MASSSKGKKKSVDTSKIAQVEDQMANLTVSPSDSIRAANTNDVPSAFQLPPQYQPRATRVNDPPIYDGTPGTLANFLTHVKMCINVDRSRFMLLILTKPYLNV